MTKTIEIPTHTRPREELLYAAQDERLELRGSSFWIDRLDGGGWHTTRTIDVVAQELEKYKLIRRSGVPTIFSVLPTYLGLHVLETWSNHRERT